LIAKYLLLTFILNVVEILSTVIILNVYHRKPNTDKMPRWVQFIFLKVGSFIFAIDYMQL
jgi:hypothetical protein